MPEASVWRHDVLDTPQYVHRVPPHDIVDPQVDTLGYHLGETSGKVVTTNSFGKT